MNEINVDLREGDESLIIEVANLTAQSVRDAVILIINNLENDGMELDTVNFIEIIEAVTDESVIKDAITISKPRVN